MSENVFSPLIDKAIEIASVWHDRTYRKGRWREEPFEAPGEEVLRTPVIAHLASVGMMLQRAGWDDRTVAAGFLHDMIEDANRFRQKMDYDELWKLIGKPVADLVNQVSEPKVDENGDYIRWRTRKETYLDQLRSGTTEAMAVSLADKIHNLWSMNQATERGIDIFRETENRRALGADPKQQLWFFRSVLEISRQHSDPRLGVLQERLEAEVERFGVLYDV